MHFTLKQLRYVESAGRLGSIAKAANEMAISQSSITSAIDSLEYWLEYDLFIRTPAKGIHPTRAGFEALGLIRGFLNSAHLFDGDLKSISGEISGLVRISCYVSTAPSFLPFILRDMANVFPNMSIRVLEGHMEQNMKFLDEGMADLAFTYEQVVNKSHDFIPLFEAPPYCLISPHDDLAKKPFVTFDELSPKPMVLLDLPQTRDYFETLFQSHGCKPSIEHTTRSAEIARALVEGGFGYTVLNIRPPTGQNAHAQYCALPIKTDSPPPRFGIAKPATIRLPKPVTAFIQRCEDLSQEGVFDQILVH